jgi:hypothetical protein
VRLTSGFNPKIKTESKKYATRAASSVYVDEVQTSLYFVVAGAISFAALGENRNHSSHTDLIELLGCLDQLTDEKSFCCSPSIAR